MSRHKTRDELLGFKMQTEIELTPWQEKVATIAVCIYAIVLMILYSLLFLATITFLVVAVLAIFNAVIIALT